jgi:hypothetical protein
MSHSNCLNGTVRIEDIAEEIRGFRSALARVHGVEPVLRNDVQRPDTGHRNLAPRIEGATFLLEVRNESS